MMNVWKQCLLLAILPIGLFGCPDDENNIKAPDNNTTEIEVPEQYAFDSRFDAGESSVSYSGQTARQVLLKELGSYMGEQLEKDALSNTNFTTSDDFVAALTYYYDFDGESNGDETLQLTTTPGAKQTTLNAISTGKNLKGKTAGNDSVTDHKDWSKNFAGWASQDIAANGGSTTSPEGLLTALMTTLGKQAFDLSEGNQLKDPINEMALPVYVTVSGLDLNQLIQKLLLMSVTYSQGTDDYLDSDVDEKGLNSSNARDGESSYTKLEHAWDEGFGYFGAARNYSAYSDEEVAIKGGRDDWQGYHDTNKDGVIDLTSEYNFALSTNAAKRDLGSTSKTDFTKEAFDAFLKGRTIIANAGEVLTSEEMTQLKAQRDIAVLAWEKAVAATIVHYINDTIKDTIKGRDDNEYDFAHHAKVWSELKGFALGLQFNPHSEFADEDKFNTLHGYIGDAPVLPNAGEEAIKTYLADLLKARDMLKNIYKFADADMGDANGEGGW